MSEEAEKVVEPSPDKKRRARKKGDVPLSQDANTAAAYLGFLVALPVLVASFAHGAYQLRGFILDPNGASVALFEGGLANSLVFDVAFALLPVTAVPAVAVILSMVAQQAIVIAPSKLKPDLNKISPVKGFGKKFGPEALVEFAKTASKVVVLSFVCGALIFFEADAFSRALAAQPSVLVGLLLREATLFLGAALGVSLFFAAIDIPLVRSQREKRLKMSEQEQRDEVKESEGDANIKSQRRQRAEKIAMSRMLSETADADVVITNPTHYAVALKWNRDGLHLPECVAKGTDELALRIRSKAVEANVPIREDPPTARSLYATVDVGEAISPEHFAAVAAAIRFADRARGDRH
ncbi:MAG: flagellar biosynthesis protein FlhB [Parvularculaceae bacterium]|nr:flagellar biosynthesis protein FlhB [Parvularculaceae bacterium]